MDIQSLYNVGDTRVISSQNTHMIKQLDEKVRNLRSGEVEGRVYTDGRNYSYRYDENNVDIDAENTYLAENQITYNALMTSIKQEFSDLKAVIK